MEQLSKLELERLQDILDDIMDTIVADDVGVTWTLEDSVIEAQDMIKKAIKTKNE